MNAHAIFDQVKDAFVKVANYDFECPVCLEVMKPTVRWITLTCGHCLCAKCMKTLVAGFNEFRDNTQTCPICRAHNIGPIYNVYICVVNNILGCFMMEVTSPVRSRRDVDFQFSSEGKHLTFSEIIAKIDVMPRLFDPDAVHPYERNSSTAFLQLTLLADERRHLVELARVTNDSLTFSLVNCRDIQLSIDDVNMPAIKVRMLRAALRQVRHPRHAAQPRDCRHRRCHVRHPRKAPRTRINTNPI